MLLLIFFTCCIKFQVPELNDWQCICLLQKLSRSTENLNSIYLWAWQENNAVYIPLPLFSYMLNENNADLTELQFDTWIH